MCFFLMMKYVGSVTLSNSWFIFLAPPIMEIKMIFEYRQTHTRHTKNGKLPPIYQVKDLLSKLSKRYPFDVKEREESFVLTNRYRVQADTHAFILKFFEEKKEHTHEVLLAGLSFNFESCLFPPLATRKERSLRSQVREWGIRAYKSGIESV